MEGGNIGPLAPVKAIFESRILPVVPLAVLYPAILTVNLVVVVFPGAGIVIVPNCV